MLHSQIQYLILTNKVVEGNAQQHLVLITGDGNANDDRTSFPKIVSVALEHQWTVELWSWKASLSSKFLTIQKKYPHKFQINHLDPHRSKITFKQKAKQQKKVTNDTESSITPAFLITICLAILIFYLYSKFYK
jgi:hypothetical protein